jgi:hypothetical protein
MKDELASSIRQQAAPDPAAVYGSAGTGDLGNSADPAAGPATSDVALDLMAPPVSAAPMGPLDIRALLHPTEHSRLLFALSSSAVVFGVAAMIVYAINGWISLVVVAVFLVAFGGLVWLSLQVYRSRLLGGAVRVSEATLPELQAVFDEVRARLDYQAPVDVYVMDKVDGGSAMTSYLGTRLIQIEGGLAAELLGEEHHAELTYMIGRHIGQLKARHQRLLPIFLAISVIDSVKFLQLFLAPYLRATAKSGDQIAAACCGDIRATAGMMNRLLVGKELGPRLAVKGVLDQAATVRRRWLPRLAQLFMSQPHATNRYLNLLAFFARTSPQEIRAWQASLDEATAARLTAVIDASPNRRPPRRRLNPVSMLLATLLTCGLLALGGWVIFGGLAGFTGEGTTTTTAELPSTGHTPTGGQVTTASRQLLARMPTGFASSCTPISVPPVDASQGVDAEVACQPPALGSGGYVTYAHYKTQGAMQKIYGGLTQGIPSGDCSSATGQESYSLRSSSQPAGDLACFTNKAGQQVFLWTDNSLAILSIAASNSMTIADLNQWWQGDSGPEHTLPGSQANQANQAQPSSPGTSSTQGAGSAAGSAGQTADPADTVRAYFAAIDNHDYAQAWKLGGQHTGSSYSSFVSGLSTTANDTVTIQSVSGNVVTARLSAQQTDGTIKTYQGTYTVSDGDIVAFNVYQVG